MNTETTITTDQNTRPHLNTKHLSSKHLDRLWWVMIGITLLNAFIAEKAEPSVMITLLICGMIVSVLLV